MAQSQDFIIGVQPNLVFTGDCSMWIGGRVAPASPVAARGPVRCPGFSRAAHDKVPFVEPDTTDAEAVGSARIGALLQA
jgi:hypothetical protein